MRAPIDRRPAPARRDGGFSLVEVVLALGLLAIVLISISGLFFVGGRHVRGGRDSSEALAVARAVLEEMEGDSLRQTYERFGLDGTAATYQVDSRANAAAAAWQERLAAMIPDAWASIELTALGPGNPAMNQSHAIRVVVEVHWNDSGRVRRVRLGTVRL